MKEDWSSLDGLEAELVHVARFNSWYEFEKGRLDHSGLEDDPPISPIGPARWPCLSETRKKWPFHFSRLAQSCFPLIAAALPLMAAGVNEAMVQDASPALTEPDGFPFFAARPKRGKRRVEHGVPVHARYFTTSRTGWRHHGQCLDSHT